MVATTIKPSAHPKIVAIIILLILLFGVFLKKWFYYKEPQFKDQLLFIGYLQKMNFLAFLTGNNDPPVSPFTFKKYAISS